MNEEYSRRDFIRQSGAFGAGLALTNLSSVVSAAAQAESSASAPSDGKALRIGFVGIGARGSNLLKILLELEGVEFRAFCDIREDRVTRAQRWVRETDRPEPSGYTKGDTDFKRMCEMEELDLVITATPWQWHVPVCVAAMEAGKHAATEVPAAVTLDECWQLVEASEKNNRHCMMLENYCYFHKTMTILNMIRKGALGELLHCEGRS